MNRMIPIVLLVAAAIVGWLAWTQLRAVPFIVSGLIEADEVRVGSRVGGRCAEVIVREGQRVQPGDPLFRLEPFDLEAQLAEARGHLAAAEAERDWLKAGYRPQEIAQATAARDRAAAVLARLEAGPRAREIGVARQRLNMAVADRELAESEYQRYQKLIQQEDAARVEYDRAVRALKSAQAAESAASEELALLEEGSREEDIAEAQAALDEAEASLRLMQEGYRAEDRAQAEAKVAAAAAVVDTIEVRVAELTITSPCDCRVEAIDLQPGDLVTANAPTVALLDESSMWLRAYVPESRLGDIALNAQVPFVVDGFPEERFTGRVTYISHDAEFTPRNVQTPEERSKQVFRIKLAIDDGRDRLAVGMMADVLLGEASAP